MAIDEILDGFDLVGRIIESGFGWRYILSKKYRNRVHQQWHKQGKLWMIGDILSVSLSFIFVNGIAAWLILGFGK